MSRRLDGYSVSPRGPLRFGQRFETRPSGPARRLLPKSRAGAGQLPTNL
jgi:hypothetical protein